MYREIRQLLITKAAAFQFHNLASAPKPSTNNINQLVKDMNKIVILVVDNVVVDTDVINDQC